MITRSSNIGGSKELHDNTSMIMFGFVYWPWSESPPKIPFRVFVLLTLASIGCLKNFVVASEKSLKVFGLLDSFVSESAILMNRMFSFSPTIVLRENDYKSQGCVPFL